MNVLQLSNGIFMPQAGLGMWTLHGKILRNAVLNAVQMGYRMFDTAYLYENEKELSSALDNCNLCRDDFFIISKVCTRQLRGRIRYLFTDKKSVSANYKQSLRNFNMEYLDLYLMHSVVYNPVKVYAQLVDLYKEGRVRAIGVCNATIKELDLLIKKVGFVPHVHEFQLHPLYVKKELIKYCNELNITCIAHTQFARGTDLLFQSPVIVQIASKYSKSPHQIVLRWILQQGIGVIPRSKNPQHLKNNLEIFDFNLTSEEMLSIDSMNQNISFCDYDIPSCL